MRPARGQRRILVVRENAAPVVEAGPTLLEQDADDRALCGQHLEDSPLVVEPQQVIPGQAESADRWLSADGAMWSMPVVAMGEEGQLLGALL